MSYKILAVNPSSTSTIFAVYEDENVLFEKTLRHSPEEILKYYRIYDQMTFRKKLVLEALEENKFDMRKLDAVVGRGGVLRSIESGTYSVNEKMLSDLKMGVSGAYASNLGGLIANAIGKEINIPSFIVDPVVVDELDDIARISGFPDIERTSIFHALNQKAMAKRYAKENGIPYEKLNLIVVHLGGEISVGAHRGGKIVDVNNALNGDGPFSPERSGGIPVSALVKLCYSGKYTEDEMIKKITGKGGLVAYLGTNNFKEVVQMVHENDKHAKLIYDAFIYQIGKEIGKCAAVLKGKVDAIILTGGIAYNKEFTDALTEMISFISKIVVYPGEDELLALTQGGLRVLKGEEKSKIY